MFPPQKKKLQKNSIIKLRGLYNTGLQFSKNSQVPGKWDTYSDSFFSAEQEY